MKALFKDKEKEIVSEMKKVIASQKKEGLAISMANVARSILKKHPDIDERYGKEGVKKFKHVVYRFAAKNGVSVGGAATA